MTAEMFDLNSTVRDYMRAGISEGVSLRGSGQNGKGCMLSASELRGLFEQRPSWDTWALSLASVVATRADCTRAQVGAVILAADHRVLSVGFNGLPAGIPGCASAGNCPRGKHSRQGNIGMRGELGAWCSCGGEWPCPDASAPDSDYSNCAATHAEANAIRHAPAHELPRATLCCTRRPCPACTTLINAAGIARVVTPEGEI